MPEDMSMARRLLVRSYGAEVVLTPAQEGMAGAVEHARRITNETPGAFMPRQFDNVANPDIHEQTTGDEIWRATRGELSACVIGVGTGGTLTGVARALKKHSAAVRIVAAEPKASAVLSGGEPGPHGIQGLGAGFVPKVLDRGLIDEVVTVTDLAADRMQKRLAREEGILAGPSSGANVHAAVELAKRMRRGERIVTLLPDTGERYLV